MAMISNPFVQMGADGEPTTKTEGCAVELGKQSSVGVAELKAANPLQSSGKTVVEPTELSLLPETDSSDRLQLSSEDGPSSGGVDDQSTYDQDSDQMNPYSRRRRRGFTRYLKDSVWLRTDEGMTWKETI